MRCSLLALGVAVGGRKL